MVEEKQYTVDLLESEFYSLQECLNELRKKIFADYQTSHSTHRIEAKQNPIFTAACKLQFKLAKIVNPNTDVSLEDYLNM